MKKIATISIVICALMISCTNHQDDKDFIRNMYDKSLYEDYAFPFGVRDQDNLPLRVGRVALKPLPRVS